MKNDPSFPIVCLAILAGVLAALSSTRGPAISPSPEPAALAVTR